MGFWKAMFRLVKFEKIDVIDFEIVVLLKLKFLEEKYWLINKF